MPLRTECKLRPVQESDLDLILRWRNSKRISSQMYTDHIINQDEHRAWFANLKTQAWPLYLVFEWKQQPVGLVYFTDFDQTQNKCLWGFYLGEESTPPGVGSAMGFLGLEYIFESKN